MTQEIITITVEAGQMTARRKSRKIAQRRPVPVWAIVERTITDIVCMHSVKAGTVKFLYELDNDGRLVEIVR